MEEDQGHDAGLPSIVLTASCIPVVAGLYERFDDKQAVMHHLPCVAAHMRCVLHFIDKTFDVAFSYDAMDLRLCAYLKQAARCARASIRVKTQLKGVAGMQGAKG